MTDETGTAHADLSQLSAADLRQRVEDLDGEIETLREVYYALHAQRQTATLSRDGYIDYLATEDRLGVLVRTVEGLRPQLEYAQLREEALAGKAEHDAGIAASAQLVEAVLAGLAQLAGDVAALVQHFDAQTDRLFLVRSRQGLQQFQIPVGHQEVRMLLERVFPGDFRAGNMVGARSQGSIPWQTQVMALGVSRIFL